MGFDDWLAQAMGNLHRPQVMVELALLAMSLLLALALTRSWARWQDATPREGLHRAAELGLGSLRRLSFPLFALCLLVLARFVVHRWMGHPQVLPAAMTLLLAMGLIRMVAFVFEHTFARGYVVAAAVRGVSTLVWLTVALHLMGVLPDLIALLDDIGFHVGQQRISVWLLLQGGVTVMLTLVLALWISGLVEDRLRAAEGLDSSLRVVFSRMSRALFMVVAVLVALPLVGIDLTTLSVFGGALGVGLGFGLQKIASNYVSGFIILLDRSIRLGSVISVGTDRGEVTRITTRYTVLKGITGVEAIVPNEVLVSSVVLNESYTDSRVRQAVPVQVAYGTDLEQALALLEQAARSVGRVLANPAPKGYVLAFADSGINLELGFWIDDPQNGTLGVKSDVNLAIWHALQGAGISIPFPQREVRVLGREALASS